MWAPQGQTRPSRSPSNSKALTSGVPSAVDGSSARGALISAAPLFHRPTICAPSRSADAGSDAAGSICDAAASFTDRSNSGTLCASRRNTRNAPLAISGIGGSCTGPLIVKSAAAGSCAG
jgi:hypothetical protein